MKRERNTAISYALLFLLEIIAVAWMASGIRFSSGPSVLSANRLEMLRYFTVDSNILMGIVAAVIAWENLQVLQGKKEQVPGGCYYWNLAATTGVALTFLVTVGFLAPQFGKTWYQLFQDSNFLMHLIAPVTAILLFIFAEGHRMNCFPATLSGLVPMAIYAAYYCVNAIVHAENGIVPESEDWYGFLRAGSLKRGPAVILIFIAGTWLITFALWALQQKRQKDRETVSESK